MATSVEAVVNQALIEIGARDRISDIFEGSTTATAALEIYGQTRDELLDAGEWPLARRANVPLTLLKGPPPAGGYNPLTPWAPTYPPPGWLYEYAYPDDMLNLRAVQSQPNAMFDLDPKPATWRTDNDNSLVDRNGSVTTQKKIILSNVKNAIATYTAQITDPALWEPGFTRLMVETLSKKLAIALADSLPLAQLKLAEAGRDGPAATGERG